MLFLMEGDKIVEIIKERANLFLLFGSWKSYFGTENIIIIESFNGTSLNTCPRYSGVKML